MHNLSQSCKLIKFTPVESLSDQTADFLEQTFDVVVINYTDDGLEEYVVYAPLSFDEQKFRRQITQSFPDLPEFHTEFLESKNWLKENVIKFAPFEIGSFLIYGIHEPTCPQTNKGYIAYSEHKKDNDGNEIMLVSSYDPNISTTKLYPVTDPKEMELVQEVFDKIKSIA